MASCWAAPPKGNRSSQAALLSLKGPVGKSYNWRHFVHSPPDPSGIN